MNITDVRVRLIRNAGNFKAIATVTIDNALAVHDIKVISTGESTFIAMPSKKRREGTFTDIVHPINSETRAQLQECVLAKYAEVLSANPEEETSDDPDEASITHD